MKFDGKSVFITGGSAGIGAALAVAFAEEGANVAVAARRLDKLQEVVARIEAAGAAALAVECDVTRRASIDAAIAKTVEAFGGLDVVVANAGFGVSGPLERLETDDYRRQFETNVFGLIDTTKAALPHLIVSRGRLALVSSVLGRIPSPAYSAYTASKYAVCGFADSIYYELAQRGVSVTSIEPGLIESDFRMTDSQGRFHGDRKDPAPQWLVMPVQTAARQMLRAIHRRKPQAIITLHGTLGVGMYRHFPRTFRTVFRWVSSGRLEKIERTRRASTGQS
jgi:NAD(P)-dependent dehydrogenase (short-subunit alcohol dehydrogenase family)